MKGAPPVAIGADFPHPVPIRDAASVLLLRDGHSGVETFTLTRASTMVFAAGATVFPGGGVDHGDHLTMKSPGVVATSSTTTKHDDDSLAQTLRITALRETFEESGVLLGVPAGFRLPSPAVREQARLALEEHQISLAALFADWGLQPDPSVLHPTARWITPEGYPRRYDTRFFLAVVPADQEATAGSRESTSAEWMTPQHALERFERGETHLMRPTRFLLNELSRYTSTEEALSAAPFQRLD